MVNRILRLRSCFIRLVVRPVCVEIILRKVVDFLENKLVEPVSYCCWLIVLNKSKQVALVDRLTWMVLAAYRGIHFISLSSMRLSLFFFAYIHESILLVSF